MPFRASTIALASLLALAVPGVASAADTGGPAVTRGGSKSSAARIKPASTLSSLCEAAEKGDATAAYKLARRYLFGVGVKRNKRIGTSWLRAAASRGHTEARRLTQYVPGRMGRIRPTCRPNAGPLRALSAPPAEIVRIVNGMAPDYGLDPALVLAVIQAESAFRTDAVSPKEAAGLMQLIPATAERFAVRDVFDPADNIRGGMKYLRWLLAYFEGDVNLALAGYNAGEGVVDRYRGIPPYEETRSYVRLIRSLYTRDRHPFDASVASPSPAIGRRTATLPQEKS